MSADMIIFATPDGVRLEYTPPQPRQAVPVVGQLRFESTTPHVHFEWRCSRGALLRIALRCLRASVTRSSLSI